MAPLNAVSYLVLWRKPVNQFVIAKHVVGGVPGFDSWLFQSFLFWVIVLFTVLAAEYSNWLSTAVRTVLAYVINSALW